MAQTEENLTDQDKVEETTEQDKVLETLEAMYSAAEKFDLTNPSSGLTTAQRHRIHIVAELAPKQKGVIALTVTAAAKKIVTPIQDIRKMKTEVPGGYSARSLDKDVTSKFMRKKFGIHFAMMESGATSRTLEQNGFFTLRYKGNIGGRNGKIKMPFLRILDDMEKQGVEPKNYLLPLFASLIKQKKEIDKLAEETAGKKVEGVLPVSHIMTALEAFLKKGGSRSPVIAVKTILDLMQSDVKRYAGMNIPPLESHTASDDKTGSTGDIEFKDGDEGFEGYEIKHNIEISESIVLIACDKIRKKPMSRYVILTTSKVVIEPEEEKEVKEAIDKIYEDAGCEVIVDNVQNFVYSNLRLTQNPIEFMNKFGENLADDHRRNGSFNRQHLKLWQDIIEKSRRVLLYADDVEE